MITLMVITDGRRECLHATLRSLRLNVSTRCFGALVVVNDSPCDEYRHWLNSTMPPVAIVVHSGRQGRQGFAAAIQAGWDALPPATRYVLHMEDDFTFNKAVDMQALCGLLDRQGQLAQVVLKRQAWNELERAAGGIVEQHPDDYTERRDALAVWTEHRRFFSTNPSVYRASLTRLGWPQQPESEGVFTHRLLADPLLRFAFWGAKHDPPVVHHIGLERAGHGY